jgi:hypothetical protein
MFKRAGENELKRLYSNSFLELQKSFNTIEALSVLNSQEFIVVISTQSRMLEAKNTLYLILRLH